MNNEFVQTKSIQTAIIDHHYQDMKIQITGYKKLENMADEDLREVQTYFNGKYVAKGRLAFRIRSQILDNIPANFKSKF